MRVAYLIMAHHQPAHFGRLIAALDCPWARFFILVDRKSPIEPFLGDWPVRLEATARNLWAASERLRPGLLDADYRQVEMGRQAYARLRELV